MPKRPSQVGPENALSTQGSLHGDAGLEMLLQWPSLGQKGAPGLAGSSDEEACKALRDYLEGSCCCKASTGKGRTSTTCMTAKPGAPLGMECHPRTTYMLQNAPSEIGILSMRRWCKEIPARSPCTEFDSSEIAEANAITSSCNFTLSCRQ